MCESMITMSIFPRELFFLERGFVLMSVELS